MLEDFNPIYDARDGIKKAEGALNVGKLNMDKLC